VRRRTHGATLTRGQAVLSPASVARRGGARLTSRPLALLVFAAALTASALPTQHLAAQATTQRDAERFSTTAFARTIERLSERGGYFDTDNLISNESSYLHVVGKLGELGVRGGAYIGVGPDQNFSYIAHIRPRIALIIDIRRDNLLQQLLFKALFSLAPNRTEYLALLLGRPVPRRSVGPDLQSLLAYMDSAPMRRDVFDHAHERVRARMLTFGIPLSAQDLATIRRFHLAFHESGLDLRFETHGRAPRWYYPTYRQLLLERDLHGRLASYLAREESYQFVRRLQERNLIVPVVGDLAGRRALKQIAAFLEQRGDPVSAFYTSNVEFYLMGDGTFDEFMDNVRRLPRNRRSVIIRSYFPSGGGPHPQAVQGYYSTQLLQRFDDLIDIVERRRIRSYFDLVTTASIALR
jgi:hypothetical protein